MNKFSIDYQIQTSFVKEILKLENIEELKKTRFLESITSKKEYANIYFLQSEVDEKILNKIRNAKLTIVKSNTIKAKLMNKYGFKNENIEVFYPTFNPKTVDEKLLKKQFLEEFGIDSSTKVIFFKSSNLKKDGVKEFCQVISRLQNKNIKVIVESTKKQMDSFKFKIINYNLGEKVVLYENFKNSDFLFLVSDIFFIPTYSSAFNSNILKAMYYKNAVFTTAYNHSCEILDTFSTLNNPDDQSIVFKIDALLSNFEELENIKMNNFNIAKEYILAKEIDRFKQILKTN